MIGGCQCVYRFVDVTTYDSAEMNDRLTLTTSDAVNVLNGTD